MNDQSNTAKQKIEKSEAILKNDKASASEKDIARKEIAEAKTVIDNNDQVVGETLKKLDDQNFLKGFGNNGGEEFLSYMNISEMVVIKGGKEWETWDRNISSNLNRIQNGDGSWSGDHCITGRTFCTATALLTLMADRTPIPESSKKKMDEIQKTASKK